MATASVAGVRNTESRFLQGLAAPDLRAVLSAARQRRYLAHSVIVNQGTPANHFFLLVSGRARYFYTTPNGRKSILMWLPPGQVFGAAAIMTHPVEYLVSTEAVKNCVVLDWDRATIRGLIARYPQLTDNALLIMFDYFAFYLAAHTSLICNSARERLAFVLANLAKGIGQRVAGGIELEVRNEELANEANVTPFTASRLLREWQRQGILTKQRGRILLHSPEQLLLHEV